MKTITHIPFLRQVIEQCAITTDVHGASLLIFPTQLSIDYAHTIINQAHFKNVSSSSCITLHAYILMHSRLQETTDEALMQHLYDIVHMLLRHPSDFETFYDWGMTLLKDFNLIDQYLLDGHALFSALIEQKQLNVPLEVMHLLYPSQRSNSSRDGFLFQQKGQHALWEQLPLIYDRFIHQLNQIGYGYKGLCYKSAINKLESIQSNDYQRLAFIGFNLFTPSEEAFIERCKDIMPIEFYWDIDSHYLDNELNIAGHALRKHRKNKLFQGSFHALKPISYLHDSTKKVTITHVSSMVAIVQLAIDSLIPGTDKKNRPSGQTALVISGGNLLMPLLEKLTALSIPLHCRLPYPLKSTSIYSVIEKLVIIWLERNKKSTLFIEAYSGALQLLRPWIKKTTQDQFMHAIHTVKSKNSYEEASLPMLAGLSLQCQGFFAYLKTCLLFLNDHFSTDTALLLDLNRSALQYLLDSTDWLVAMERNGAAPTPSFFLRYLREKHIMLHQNNPLCGLYIIDVMEAYNLDFEHIFFLDTSEGMFPKPHQERSFLTYNVRNSFELPLPDKTAQQLTTYGFYRLLQRTQDSFCIYSDHLGCVTEMSALLRQLIFETNLDITEESHIIYRTAAEPAVQTILKDTFIMQALERFLIRSHSTPHTLTPTALISYISCPLQFYFSYVLRLPLTAPLPSQDKSDMDYLGTLFHRVMANLYNPLIGQPFLSEFIQQCIEIAPTVIQEALSSHSVDETDQHALLLSSLLEQLVGKMLALDHRAIPFTLLHVEKSFSTSLVLDRNRAVSLGGKIDRIDAHQASIRIIDYKTGRSSSQLLDIEGLFDPAHIVKNRAIFQVFFYGWLFNMAHGSDRPLAPYLINMREAFSHGYQPGIQMPKSGHPAQYEQIEDMRNLLPAFETHLKNLLLELFDIDRPFKQTEDIAICTTCPYVKICQRDS